MALSQEELNTLNQQGFIAGPGESEADFLKRVDYCRGLKDEMEELPANQAVEESYPLTKKWFGIIPHWVPILFSNHQLALWHGGCAWIFQKDEATPTGAFLQLRKTFYHHKSFLGIYKRDEFIAHELSHVGRMMFEEPRFEEVLAYRTASSSFQKMCGPLVRSSAEAIIFVALIIMLLMVDLMILAMGYFNVYSQLMWLKLAPLMLIFLAIYRLVLTQSVFKKCQYNLMELLKSSDSSRAVAYRLTDHEIEEFAKMSPEEIKAHAESMRDKELRWKQIYPYFRRC